MARLDGALELAVVMRWHRLRARIVDALDIVICSRAGYESVDTAVGVALGVALSPLVVWLVRWLCRT